MRRARGARIIGQADALAASCGGPAAQLNVLPPPEPGLFLKAIPVI
jgi:hypothetical protein